MPESPPPNARYAGGVYGREVDDADRDDAEVDDAEVDDVHAGGAQGGADPSTAGRGAGSPGRAAGAAGRDAAIGDRSQDAEPGDDGDGSDDAEDDGDGGDSRSLAVLDRLQRRQRPPKRTGVFLDPDELRDHVGGLLRIMLGGYQVDAWGNFTFVHDGARVFVTVQPSPVGPQIGVLSVTNLDVELTSQLAGFLLTTNHQLGFGGFSYDPQSRAVWLRHTLLGTTLDFPELQAAVAAVANTAAHFVSVIKQRFGGRTFEEAPQDVQDSTQPPVPSEPSDDRRGNAGGYL